jgi:hypothetical protein
VLRLRHCQACCGQSRIRRNVRSVRSSLFCNGANQLNLCVGEAFGRQVGQHLVVEQMRVQRLRNAGHLPDNLGKTVVDANKPDPRNCPSLKSVLFFTYFPGTKDG